MVFDARGHFHEPHTGHGVPLGTIEIRKYLEEVASHRVGESDFDVRKHQYPTRGPQHRYGAILFVEKEGFMPLFDHVQLAKRYDIAIMSTKGMSVTASRNLLDTICFNYTIPLLVVHDFDKSGFSIVGTLRRDTRRYAFQNKIDVIDVGMRLDDIEDLQRESSGIKPEARNAARCNLRDNGATRAEIDFLLEQRVELNAFTSDQLVNWIEGKLVEQGVKKIIPDDATLAVAYRRAREQTIVQALINDELRKWREEAGESVVPTNLRSLLEHTLATHPNRTWDDVIRNIAIEAGP